MTILGYTPTLDWTDSIPPAVRYDVQIATDNGFVNVLGRGQGGPTGVSQYTVEVPLDPNTPSYPYYYWRVRAYNGDSPFGVFIFSEWSGVASFKTPP
jgi:phosphodiesterase/alkaline phosphatase D-like protein